MSSSGPSGSAASGGPPVPTPKDAAKTKPAASKAASAPEVIDVIDKTPFPAPELFFKVYDSELDEPRQKIRRDVNLLYERWIKLHGRRWPDKGLDTEDMVWLQEEAHRPDAMARLDAEIARGRDAPPQSNAYINPKASGMHPEEMALLDGEFISEPGEAPPGVVPSRPLISNYEATKAGAKWVTDEYESECYEAGNMELLWDRYLWDRDGNPLVMPEGGADEAAGEESEEWDDFHTAYRPRGIDSERARAAVWATDEFESDEDNTESEFAAEYVGAGLGLDHEDPINPQYSLRHSTHPLAPFPGEPLKWASWVYEEGTTYEGLAREGVPHGMGVMYFGNGTGGGFHFRDVRRGDKYEGEFQAGYAHGLGQFTSEARGEVYVGEFFAGQRHGCGLNINMRPFWYLLERGEEPLQAYKDTYETIMRNMEFKTWYRNRKLGSDYEDELVLAAVENDFENPYDVLLRNGKHEAKLKDWKRMSAEEKAYDKMHDIIRQDGANRMAIRAKRGFNGPSYFRKEDGEWVADLDSQCNDTEFDSVELMVGNETDGGFGLGWHADSQDSDEFPMDPKVSAEMYLSAVEGRQEEDEDKKAVLGENLVNPSTGLTMHQYLDGKESKMNELLGMTMAEKDTDLDSDVGTLLPGGERQFAKIAAMAQQKGAYHKSANEDPNDQTLLEMGSSLTPAQQRYLVDDMEFYDSLNTDGSLTKRKNVAEEGTDTRFETESDVMELCDLAEILGTVQEAQEIVQRARMWRWKPYGEVTIRFAQDAHGNPVDVFQDPLHYPFGTKFMAPGPLGQCHPVPDDQNIRVQMLRVAHNYKRIYDMYNFDYDPEPGTAQYIVDQRIKRMEELRTNSLARMAAAAEDELKQEEAPLKLELASTTGVGAATRGVVSASAFASASLGMSVGMSSATKAMMNALTMAGRHAAPKRPQLWYMRRRPQAAATAKPRN